MAETKPTVQLFGGGQTDDKKKTVQLFGKQPNDGEKNISLFGFDEKTPTSKQAIQKIKEEADKNERNKYGIVGDLRDSTVGLFGQLGDLAEYGWTKLTNKNEDWGINDYKKFNEYSKQMSESSNEQEYSNIYNKMIREGVIDETKYNAYLEGQKNDKNYGFNKAKEEGKNVFNNKFESALSPIIKQATNRYQIDAIGKGISQIEDQYSMAFENAMNAYNDTRDERILEEWLKTSAEYEKAIIKVSQDWAQRIVKGKTYGEAYSETIQDAANKALANDIVSLERHMTNKLFDYTIERNFNDANEYASAGNLLQSLNSTVLGAKNYLTWGLQQVGFATEEAKEFVTGRYDVTEELANLYVFDEDANGFDKIWGGAKWIANWTLDSLPQIAPLAGEILATRKMPGGILKRLDNIIDVTKGANQTRKGFRNISRFLTDMTMDNLVYDEAFQVLVGHPITGEEENINLLFNTLIDGAQAWLNAPAKYFNNALKPEDLMNKNISVEALQIAKKLDEAESNLKILSEELVILRGMEITEGSKANKKWLKNSLDLDSLDPELAAKYKKIQEQAYQYAERMRYGQMTADDAMLFKEEQLGRKAKNVDLQTAISDRAELARRKGTIVKQMGDYMFSAAKSVGQTFKQALEDGRLTENELRTSVKKMTQIDGIDDLIIGLAKGDATLRNIGLEKIEKSGKKLTREEINNIYNGTIIDIIESKGKVGGVVKDNFIKQDEWIGKFKKNANGEYIDVYGGMNKENIGEVKPTYTLDDVLKYIKRTQGKETIGADKFKTYDGIAKAYNDMMAALEGGANADGVWDATSMFSKIDGLNIWNWGTKTTGEKEIIRDMLKENGFKITEDNGQILIECPYENLNKLYHRMLGLQDKEITVFGKEDVDAYKMLFFGDIYNSFRTLANDVSLNGGNVAEFKNEFKTFFEKQFDINGDQYTFKKMLSYDDEAVNIFKELFGGGATFIEMENAAASNLIKNILREADLKDINDQTLYNSIHDLVIKGRYFKGKNDKKALPIVNSLFNQAKWMMSLGISEATSKAVADIFGQLIVDKETISALSYLNSDYLYKTVISRLILENQQGVSLYKDGLVKLFQQISTNSTKQNKKLIKSLNSLTEKVKGLSSDGIIAADKVILLNKVQEAFEVAGVKYKNYSKVLNSGGVTNKNGIYSIKNAKKLTNENITNLSDMLAQTIFRRNGLPNSTLLTKLSRGIANTLENLRATGGKLEFSIGQGLKENNNAINLTLLSDIQLAQLLKDPDNEMQMIISKRHLQKSLDGYDELAEKSKAYEGINLEEYRNAISGLKGLVEGGYDKTTDELINEVIKLLDDSDVLNKGTIQNKLIELYTKVQDKSIAERTATVGKELKDNINKIQKIIDLMNIPGNNQAAERVAQQLYDVKQLLERARELTLGKKTVDEFEQQLSATAKDLKQLERPSFLEFNGVVSKSKTVQDTWKKGTNEIYMDSPYNMKWNALKNKRIVILDTETSGLEHETQHYFGKKPRIIQLSYRVLEIGDDGTVKLVKKPSETYRYTDADVTPWVFRNAQKNRIKPGKADFNNKSELFKDLEELNKDSNTYFVGHNLDFDLDRLSDAGLKLDRDRAISTDLVGSALLPVGPKNHSQEAIQEAFEPIQHAIEKLKDDEGIKGAHHNATIDVLELQETLGYLINHAVKNNKTTEGNLLNEFIKYTKDIKAERDAGQISANATPFYKFENGWIQNKKSRNEWGLADYSFDMPYLLTQMFGSNQTREYINYMLEEFNGLFKNKQGELNIHDVINSVGDKLGDERALFILDRVREMIGKDAVMDVNKVLLGEEVKNAFVKAQKIAPDMTFSEFCTNRLVANILSSQGMYNEGVIKSLNDELNKHIQQITIDKLVDGKVGSLDTEAFMKILRQFNREGLVNLGKEGSSEYAIAIDKILNKLRGTDINIDKNIGGEYNLIHVTDEEGKQILKDNGDKLTKEFNVTEDGLMFPLSEFNKALSDYIKTGKNPKGVSFALKNLMSDLFGTTKRLGDQEVFAPGLFPEYMGKQGNADLIGDFSRRPYVTKDKLPFEKTRPEDLDALYLSKAEELYDLQEAERALDDYIYDLDDLLNKRIINAEEYNRRISAARTQFTDKNVYLEHINKQLEDGEITIQQYNAMKNSMDRELKKRAERREELREEIKEIQNEYTRRENNKKKLRYDELSEEQTAMREVGDEARAAAESEDESGKLSQTILQKEENQATRAYKDKDTGKRVTAGDDIQVDWQESSLESRMATFMDTLLSNSDFTDNLYGKNPLTYNNMFLIDETYNSADKYLITSYNGIIDMLQRGGADNKDKMIDFLDEQIAKAEGKMAPLKDVFNEVKRALAIDNTTAADKQAYKDVNKEKIKQYEEYQKWNSVKSFAFNARNTLNGDRVTVGPINLARMNGFNEKLIGSKTNQGTIKGVVVNIKIPGRDTIAYRLFDGSFSKEDFISNYMDALNKKGKIVVGYELDGLKKRPTTENIKPDELFDSSFGKYILEEFGLDPKSIPEGEYNKTLPAIINIKSKIKPREKDDKWSMFRDWVDNGKEGPRTKWGKTVDNKFVPDEKIWIEGIDYSPMKYCYITGLSDEATKKVDALTKGYKDIRTYITKVKDGREKLDTIVKEDGYNSVGELIWKNVIKPEEKKGSETMREWWNEYTVKKMMKDLVVDKGYKENVDKVYKKPTVYYKLDNYVFQNDKSLEYDPMLEKVMNFSVTTMNSKGNKLQLKVVGMQPQFYRVRYTDEVDEAMVEMKRLRGETLPDNEEELGKEIIDIEYPDTFITNAQERAELLRQQDATEWRETFEHVHDMDYVKVKLEDQFGNPYVGYLDIHRFQKNIDEGGNETKPGTFRLRDVKPYKNEKFEVSAKSSDELERIRINLEKYANDPYKEPDWLQSALTEDELKIIDDEELGRIEVKLPGTRKQYEKAKKELDEGIEEMRKAREYGDLSENSEFDAAAKKVSESLKKIEDIAKASRDRYNETPARTNDIMKEPDKTIYYGNAQKVNWNSSKRRIAFVDTVTGKSSDEMLGKGKKLKGTSDETTREIEEQSNLVIPPKDIADESGQKAEQMFDDAEDMLDVNPFKEKEKEIWNTRLLNFTNYDVFNKSDELQQIVGLRSFFIARHGEDLRAAIDKWNELIKNYGPEEQDRIYKAIQHKAQTMTMAIKDSSRELHPGTANMSVNGLSKDLQAALDDIGQVFVAGKWNPQYQYLMLTAKNDGFEGILKNIGHNHKGAAVEYKRCTGVELEKQMRNIVTQYVTGDKAIKNAVDDILGDPLNMSTMSKMVQGLRSFWRFVKYGPVLFPLSGVLMLANSAVLGVMRYGSETKGFRGLMNTDAFKILTAKKGDKIKLSNGKEAVGLGLTDAMNRTNEIMFNSNSDLGGTWFDRCLDTILNVLPDNGPLQKQFKNIATTAMKGGTHSLFDLFAQGSVKSMEFAKALEKNLIGWGSIDDLVKGVQDGTISQELVNKILADTEKGYSRFFTNSATTLFSRHRFSRWYMLNALQGYVINRTDEIFSSIKDCVNWIGRQQKLYNKSYGIKELEGKGIAFNWKDFVNYINYDNQELKALLMNVLLSAKIGFYMDRLVNGGEFNGKEYSDYMIDTSDYLSSIPATFFYGILTAPLTGIEDYAEYVKMNNEDFDVGNGLTVAGLNTVSTVLSKLFREGKVLNALTDSIVAFGKTGNIELGYDVLETELKNIADGLGRFQLSEGTHKYGLDYMTTDKDMLGKILFNSDKVSNAGQITQKLYSIQTVDGILNGEDGDWWKNRLLPYIPVFGQALQNAITGQGYTFTQAKRKELQHIMDKDKVVQILNNWDLTDPDYGKEIWRDEGIYTNEAVSRMYKELTAFNYPYKQRISGTDFKTGYQGELEQLKETVFTDELMRGLGWTDEDLTNFLNSADDRKKAGLMKIMAAAQAGRPGSSKIVLSYLANQREYELLKQVSGKDYPSSSDITDEEMAEIERQVLQEYYPYMFLADKTSRYKAITEYVSQNYQVFKDLYKDDDLTGYLSTLGYMDMIMYQQAKTGNSNAKWIKNAWSVLSKYIKSEPARITAISYTLDSINNSGMSQGKAASSKMGILAANMDFYDKIQKNGMMQALYKDDIERYNWFVWGVLDEINKQGLNLSSENKKYSGNKYYKPYKYQNGLGDNNIPLAKQFVPAAKKYLNGRTPSGRRYNSYTPNTYGPTGTFNWQLKYYENLIKTYSDRLVKSTGKKYPAEGTEKITFKTGSHNRGSIRKQQLSFPKHKSKEYRTNVISNLPGSHG